MRFNETLDAWLYSPRGGRGGKRSIADRIDATGDCWTYDGAHSNSAYPHNGDGLLHKQMWERLVGPVPEGMELDHLCRNTKCINPDHLEPVTHGENIQRGFGFGNGKKYELCHKGHDDWSGSKKRYCRTCSHERTRRYRAEVQ